MFTTDRPSGEGKLETFLSAEYTGKEMGLGVTNSHSV